MPHTAPDQERRAIEALIVGHFSRDLLPDGGWRPGGAAYYAGVALARLGMRVGIVTSAPADLAARATEDLGAAELAVVDATVATTFENIYTHDGRTQFLRGVAQPLTLEDIPEAWRSCEIALLAPVAGELSPTLARRLDARIIGAAPQGWMRQWGADGRVRPRDIGDDTLSALRPHTALVLSREDLTGPTEDPAARQSAAHILSEWSRRLALVVATCGAGGADLWQDGVAQRVPGYPAREVDPTGAGDVFTAGFLWSLAAGLDPLAAVDRANRIAALSVEGAGASAIPTLAQVEARYPQPAS